jgi:hypothetical protein
MANLTPILETWKRYLDDNDFYKWCESIVFLLEIFSTDFEFKATLIDEANKIFLLKLDNDAKSDVFFYLLGKMR